MTGEVRGTTRSAGDRSIFATLSPCMNGRRAMDAKTAIVSVVLAAIAGATVALPNHARAQAAVACVTCETSIEAAIRWAQQAADMGRQISEAKRQYDQLQRTYYAIAHATDLTGVARALGGVARTYLPEAQGLTDALVGGAQVLDSGRAMLNRDRLLTPQGIAQMERGAQAFLREMQARENVTASAKSIAADGIRDMQGRIRELSAAQAMLQAAKDGTAVAAISGLIATSRANLDAHNASINHIRLLLDTQARTERMRDEQMAVSGAQAWGAQNGWADGLVREWAK